MALTWIHSFQPIVTSSERELICHRFACLSTRKMSMSMFFLSWILRSVPGCFSSWVLGSRPWLFFFSWVLGFVPGCFSSRVLGSRPWLFFFLHVHMARVSPNLLLTLWVFHRRFGAFEAFFVSISQNLFHTCLLWHRPFSSLPNVGPLFCCLFTCLLLALLM